MIQGSQEVPLYIYFSATPLRPRRVSIPPTPPSLADAGLLRSTRVLIVHPSPLVRNQLDSSAAIDRMGNVNSPNYGLGGW